MNAERGWFSDGACFFLSHTDGGLIFFYPDTDRIRGAARRSFWVF